MKKCHFIGIGGIGMSGLARLMLGKQVQVSGSDIASNVVTEMLSQAGAKVYIGHSAQHIMPETTVVYSTDIKEDNPEYQAALHLNCPMMHRSELLRKLMESSRSLTVAGTHGKTTTSALLAWVLESAGESPSYAIGGVVPQLSSNAGQGSGNYFVAEACESDGSFLNYSPFGSIVTNIDTDHMDYYRTEVALVEAFKKFMEQVVSSHHLFWCGDDPCLQKLQPKGISYGFGSNCQLRAVRFFQRGWSTFFDAAYHGKTYANIEVSLTGKHNALNALAVFGLCLALGLDESAVRSALKSFKGVMRRCERKGESHGILFLDDYAHHPTELQTTLEAIRKAVGERRLIAVYQPHRYSRAKECMGRYGHAFDSVDELFITEIYAAREAPIPGVSHEEMINEVRQDLKNRCQHVSRNQAADLLSTLVRPHDVVVTLGAGDISKLSDEIIGNLALKAPPKLKVGFIFGGRSVEHDISLISSSNIHAAMRQEYYHIEEFAITRDGVWIYGSDARQKLEAAENTPCKVSSEVLAQLLKCDIFFPVLHGPFGEDGTVQGFFDTISKAYVGCDHRSAAISMDKAASKRLAIDAGLATLPFISFSQYDWNTRQEELLQQIASKLTYPLFVKPLHLGSSIGVSKVADPGNLFKAVMAVFCLDTHVIIENGIENPREIEFAVLGNDDIAVFPPCEIYAQGKVHDYDSKYGLNPNKPASDFDAQANLPLEKIEEGRAIVKAAYKAAGCLGMARIDMFLDSEGKFWFNEINPIPGFTKYSPYPAICAANGLSAADLIDRLIILGLHRKRCLDRLEAVKGGAG